MKFPDGLQALFVLSYLVRAERLSFFVSENEYLAMPAAASLIADCWSAGVSEIIGNYYSRFLRRGQNQLDIRHPRVMSSFGLANFKWFALFNKCDITTL